ncbi:hypothetical protein [Daejeonella sp.]|jgi:hypothetical protein|uniref:hypothetical protein n=1 Tax=Daejeonella sp. TaxID=2805397 RepID=UPI0027BB1400|nr:hypothetical protein [Daejeonella sp.]
MKYAYEVLLNVSFNHTYFLNNVFESLTFMPSSSTQLLFLNNGLLLKAYRGGFRILYDTNFNGSLRSREDLISNVLECRFNISLSDNNFYNYTSIDEGADIRNKVFHFFNKAENDFDLKPMMHKGDFVSDMDLKSIVEIDETYFVKPFGILDIRIAKDLPFSYSLNFKAKETFWRYVLMSDDLQSLNNPAIIDNSGIELFDEPEFIKFSGTTGLAFKSKKPISFSQQSIQNFQLVENYDPKYSRHKVVMRALPKANPELITLIKSDIEIENKNYSEIFIN